MRPFEVVVENPVPVLYLDGEMTAEQMQERISKLRCSLPPQLAPIHFLYNDLMARNGFPTINLAKKEHREVLDEVLREGGYGLLAIDNLASLMLGIDENAKKDYDEINQWLLNLKFQGISVILVHHAGKGGDQRGTGGREDNLDVVIRLTHPQNYRAEDGCKFNVDFSKVRSIFGADAASFSLQLMEIDGGLGWTSGDTGKKELIVAMLGQEIPQKDIHKHLGCDKSLVSRAKKWAINCGLLGEDGRFTDEGRARFGGIDVDRYLVGS